MTATDLTPKTWESVTKDKLPVIVNFWAPWCSYCKALKPAFDELANEYEDRAVFAKLNVNEYEEIADKYSIKSITCNKDLL